ncbi:MAG: hypothetical protein HKL90_05955 [Elusimicrobia bacterium]|nr:hypothetical protein [Elusimicrobiota bacterium]
MKSVGFFAEFAHELNSHWAERPWLWAVPAAGLAAYRMILVPFLEFMAARMGHDAWILETGLGWLVMNFAVPAAFAALWTGDELGVNSRRALAAAALFLMPYPALLLYNWVATRALEILMVAAWKTVGSTLPVNVFLAAINVVIGTLPLSATIGSALAYMRWKPGLGLLEALGAGWRALRANAGFFAVVVIVTCLAEGTLAAAFSQWRSAGAHTHAGAPVFIYARYYALTIVKLIGGVAIPIQVINSRLHSQPAVQRKFIS